jgi:hypothetical protein
MLGFIDEAVPALGAVYPDQASIFKEQNAEILAGALKISANIDGMIASLPSRAPLKHHERNHTLPDINQDDELRPGLTFRERQEIDSKLFKSTASISYSHMQGSKYWYNVGSEADMKNITNDYTVKCLGIEMSAGDHCIVSGDGRETITYMWDGRNWIQIGGTASSSSYIEECDSYKRGLCCITEARYDDGYEDGHHDKSVSTDQFYDRLNEMLGEGNSVSIDHVNIHVPDDGLVRVQMHGGTNIYITDSTEVNTNANFNIGMDKKAILINRDGNAFCLGTKGDAFTALVAEDALEPISKKKTRYTTVGNIRIYELAYTDQLKEFSDAPRGSIAFMDTVTNGSKSATNTVWKMLDRGWVMSLCDKTDTGK